MSYQYFIDLFENYFKEQLKEVLGKMSKKDNTIWSKTLVTVILDDSVFKQWLKGLLGTEKYYGSFYSGQSNSIVYGFKVVCLGVSIDGLFYPLFLDFVPTKATDSKGNNTALKPKEVAEKLVVKWGKFASHCTQRGIYIPSFHFSCDSGYNSVLLSESCEKNHLIYISVPNKNHLFTIDNEKRKLADFVLYFPMMEEEYIQQCNENNQTIESFSWRVQAQYESQNRPVILLFFRLNGSNKVSVIYSTKLSIFRKTLRHHWFNRTYIEQFFKLLKHSMKIQNIIVRTKERFEQKLYQFMFIGFYLQKFTRYIRKQFDFRSNRNLGLEGLKRQKALRQVIIDLLGELLQTKNTVKDLLSSI